MDFHKLNPWNWFTHEEQKKSGKGAIPIKREEHAQAHFPLASVDQLHHDINRLFENSFRGFGFSALSQPKIWDQMFNDDFSPAFHANINIASDDEQYAITLEAPGLEEKDLSIDLKDRVLVIKGNKQHEKEERDKQYYRIERSYGAFERVLAVPDDADIDKISASMDKGLLTVNIPRKEVSHANVKKIEIENS